MPQLETVAMTTWSPGFTRVTREPTASTTPAPSWPISEGAGHGIVPSRRLTSLWQTPAATTPHQHLVGPGIDHLDVVADLGTFTCEHDSTHEQDPTART